MTITPREVEKLRAIGYDFRPDMIQPGYGCVKRPHGIFYGAFPNETAWSDLKAHAQSPEGLVATMAAKVRFLANDGTQSIEVFRNSVGYEAHLNDLATTHRSTILFTHGASPEAAIDALFWSVP